MSVKVTVFCDLMPCSLAEICYVLEESAASVFRVGCRLLLYKELLICNMSLQLIAENIVFVKG